MPTGREWCGGRTHSIKRSRNGAQRVLDLHCHILPDVDDGAGCLEESLEMARQAAESGVSAIVATPHANIRGAYENYWSRTLTRRIRELREAIVAEGIPLEIYPGMEVYATPEVPQLLRDRRLITINDSRYLLVEFDFGISRRDARQLLADICAAGVVPLVAHPERYDFLQAEPQMVRLLRSEGCLMQLNKASALGGFGAQARELSRWMLRERLADVMASDAHSPFRRTTEMLEAEEYVCSVCGEEYADLLFRENPCRIVQNRDVLRAADTTEA